jgi:hypothetical protein
MHRRPLALGLLLLTALSGCDYLGIESASMLAARRDTEGKAIGAACRQAGRAIEDCYTLNRKADKGAMFAGWREMNDYMRENKLEAVTPELPPPGAVATPPRNSAPDSGEEPAAEGAKKHADAKSH